ncbi:hypothetical protein JOD54_001558 [Actinokineospora baliensis]|uniref:hypothetical protein n=1 Tax=Actinokineospora baliensis TaxID=547056 RepID=UPI00195E3FBC|nr:hypothetical protein [Actinokineospora baliensis]MBM7771354.1 hypothetical protein [Actinokineospora baliensis]
MNKIARFVAVVATGSVLALGSAGMAQADTATISSASVERIMTADNALQTAVANEDLAGVQTAFADLRSSLAQSGDETALKLDAALGELQRILPGLPVPGLPIPDLGGLTGGLPVGNLPGLSGLQGLINTVTNLLTSLLGGLPTGGLPVGLPSTGGLTGGLPGLGALTGLLGGLPLVGGLTGGLTGGLPGTSAATGLLGGLTSSIPGASLLTGLLGGLPLVGGLLG